jgi:hypothetical protein
MYRKRQLAASSPASFETENGRQPICQLAPSGVQLRLKKRRQEKLERSAISERLSTTLQTLVTRPSRTTCAYRHAKCWQSQRNSVSSAASLQRSLQYLPNAPSFETRHLQAACAHLFGTVIGVLPVRVGLSAGRPRRRWAGAIRDRTPPACGKSLTRVCAFGYSRPPQ